MPGENHQQQRDTEHCHWAISGQESAWDQDNSARNFGWPFESNPRQEACDIKNGRL